MIAGWARSVWPRLIVTAAILGYLLSRIDAGAAARAVLQVDPGSLAAVLALVAFDRGLMIWRWILLLRSTGAPIARKSAAWIYLVSSFVGSFLPAGLGADAARAYTLSRRTAQNSEAIASVAIDRVLGLMSIVLMGVVGILLWAGRVDPGVRQAALWLSGLALLGAVGVWWLDTALRLAFPQRLHGHAVVRRALRLADAFGRYRRQPGTVAAVLALSLLVQLLRIVQAYLLGLGLGIDVPFTYFLVFMPVGLLMLLLPVSVSGFGLPQGVIVWLLEPVGVPATTSFALSTLIVLTGLAGNLPGAWLYLKRRKA